LDRDEASQSHPGAKIFCITYDRSYSPDTILSCHLYQEYDAVCDAPNSGEDGCVGLLIATVVARLPVSSLLSWVVFE
jgi:hypothetical protein